MQPYIICSNVLDPFTNLAVENYLVNTAEKGDVGLFLWRNNNTVVIGKNQNPYAECNVETLLTDGGKIARRTTGGGAVFHDEGNVNFSFIIDKDTYDIKRQLNVIIEALKSYGIEASFNGRNDIVTDGKKFSGNAFLNGNICCLHHGTLLIKLNSSLMAKYLSVSKEKLFAKGVKSVESRIVNLQTLNPEIDYMGLISALKNAFQKEYGTARVFDFDDIKLKKEVAVLQQKYSSSDYIFGSWQKGNLATTTRYEWGCLTLHKDIYGKTVAYSTDCLYPMILKKVELIKANKEVNFEDEKEKEIAYQIFTEIRESDR